MTKNPVKIKRNLSIGDLDAETDNDFLDTCFIDKGYLDDLLDVKNPCSIIVGRTGAGKSSLLYKVSTSIAHYKKIDPNDISVKFLEHSDIIQFMDNLGVNLDLFYKMLWRHILIIELLRLRYDIRSEEDNESFFSGLIDWVRKDEIKKKAISYFRDWGDKFWLDTDEHLKEITRKLEDETKANLGAKYSGLDVSLSGVQKLSDEQKTEITKRASQVVSGLQIKQLNEMLEMLAEYSFKDPQKHYYLLIDQLDEDWADTDTRCKFIRALIEEVKGFRKVNNIKILVALRKDLIDMVFDKTRGAGFQEEKYESYILQIQWSKSELIDLVEKRVSETYKRTYTKDEVTISDIFPEAKKSSQKMTPMEYILERTLYRPRDVLQFVNETFRLAVDKEKITWGLIYEAENYYSEKRLRSLKEEWGETFPSFDDTVEIIRGRDATFDCSELKNIQYDAVITKLAIRDDNDPCSIVSKRFLETQGSNDNDIISTILSCLYKVGAIGIKPTSNSGFIWSFRNKSSITTGEAERILQLKIHKMLHKTLDIRQHEIRS
ncbi:MULTISPECIES: DNA repair protein [unclassified Symbiopectobacterium]|uniref:P-loop ATPase, Sll1717 family n=1 Tax=unclassified Symbiopectobacterium TaxID=2794573 RepID=UPI002226F5BD|nr:MULTISPECIES: DNA repair protein [unclassified Symbiopectobacterium]MCW2473624.1 DNA repair protein [Candidatus Symbiopectobacterium sp. NZEC151]MCW2482374.1 DNA repair protein [Candidatus Symbiopectobacterium sp. NZEC135]